MRLLDECHIFYVLAQLSLEILDIISASSLFWQSVALVFMRAVQSVFWNKFLTFFNVMVNSDPVEEVFAQFCLGNLDIISSSSLYLADTFP